MNNLSKYEDTLSALLNYRHAKHLLKINFNADECSRLGVNAIKIMAKREEAKKIIKKIDRAFIELQYNYVDGYRIYKILYYRFIRETPLLRKEIIERLSAENIAHSKSTYHRVLNEAVEIFSHYMYSDSSENTDKVAFSGNKKII